MAKKAKQPKEIVLESRLQTAKLREDVLEVMLEGDTTVIKSPRAVMGIEVELLDHNSTSGCIAPPDTVYSIHFYYTRKEDDVIVRYALPGSIYVTNDKVIIWGAKLTDKNTHELTYKEHIRQ